PRYFAAARARGHGVPEADTVPDVDLRQHRVRREDVRAVVALGDGRPRGVGADESGALERGEGQAAAKRVWALGRPAATSLHRARNCDQTGSAAARRTVFRARSYFDRPYRRIDCRAEE